MNYSNSETTCCVLTKCVIKKRLTFAVTVTNCYQHQDSCCAADWQQVKVRVRGRQSSTRGYALNTPPVGTEHNSSSTTGVFCDTAAPLQGPRGALPSSPSLKWRLLLLKQQGNAAHQTFPSERMELPSPHIAVASTNTSSKSLKNKQFNFYYQMLTGLTKLVLFTWLTTAFIFSEILNFPDV